MLVDSYVHLSVKLPFQCDKSVNKFAIWLEAFLWMGHALNTNYHSNGHNFVSKNDRHSLRRGVLFSHKIDNPCSEHIDSIKSRILKLP